MGIWITGVLVFLALLGAPVFAVEASVLLFTGGTEQRRSGVRTLLGHLPFLRHRYLTGL
ncbi:hypothetical protein ACFVZT_19475 [Streptomyces sp. NPDC058321]|uniref:hypothetical protein n=2 Tax=Streptomyces TaxID=1883 RepID=UPI0036E16BB3